MSDEHTERYGGDGSVVVSKNLDDGTFVVQLTLGGIRTKAEAVKIALLIEESVTEKVRAIGGRLEWWEDDGRKG